jgi:hypothetical protein
VPLSEISVSIVAQAQSGKSRFDIRLDPPELGRIEAQLKVDSGGNVSSRLIVERPETFDLLRRDALALERALQDAGLSTGSGMQFSLADQGLRAAMGSSTMRSARRPLRPWTRRWHRQAHMPRRPDAAAVSTSRSRA